MIGQGNYGRRIFLDDADRRRYREVLQAPRLWEPTVTFRDLVRIMVDADPEATGLPAPGQGMRCLTDDRLAWFQRP